MIDPIARHAQARPGASALLAPSGTWTYAALDGVISQGHRALHSIGIGAGVRVGVHRPRTAETVALLWALWRVGAVAVPLSTRLPPAEVGRHARHAGCDHLVTGDAAVAESAPDVVAVHAPDTFHGGKTSSGDAGGVGSAGGRPLDRPATILYTSGSTGTPKAVLHTWAQHVYSAKGANANMPLGAGDRWVLSLPLYHVGGLAVLLRCALAGAAVVVASPEAALPGTLRHRSATHASMVATQFRRVLDATEGPPPPSLRGVLLGGGPIPGPLLDRGRARGWPIHTSYGCTEMGSQVTTTAPGAPRSALATAGRRLPHRRLRVEDGQILVAGRPLCEGYVTAEGLVDPRTEDGWYATGDRGRLDAQGRLHVLGRVDRMFISGGENIQPEEIEKALEQVSGVERAVVVPVTDTEYGARPVAYVDGSAPGPDEALRRALGAVLPSFKIPDAFHPLPPPDGPGPLKIDRDRLRRRAHKLHGLDPPDDT
ncbi:MAG: o-succinylbenzoate--CoA ligase [Salinibacter sp.]